MGRGCLLGEIVGAEPLLSSCSPFVPSFCSSREQLFLLVRSWPEDGGGVGVEMAKFAPEPFNTLPKMSGRVWLCGFVVGWMGGYVVMWSGVWVVLWLGVWYVVGWFCGYVVGTQTLTMPGRVAAQPGYDVHRVSTGGGLPV